MTDKVLVGFIHPHDSIRPQFRRSLTQLMMRDAATKRCIVDEIDYESSANISWARCQIVRGFLDHPAKPDWLWMVDSDMSFDSGILDELLAAADRKERPIVGGLCFGVRPVKGRPVNGVGAAPLELFPTIFTLSDAGMMEPWAFYPPDSVVQVHSTGAACLLVHRSVLADKRWLEDGHPEPWFRESVLNGGVCSEDHFFCLRAGSFGFPVHLNTRAKTGHVKCFIADEDMYVAQLAAKMVPPADEGVDVIVPVMRRPENVAPLVESLKSTPLATVSFVVDESDRYERAAVLAAGAREIVFPCTGRSTAGTFAEKVNYALERTFEPWVFPCGDDVQFAPDWLDQALAEARRTGNQVIGTNDLGHAGVMAGKHATHMLIRRDYIDELGASWDGPGVVCHEGYRHNFVDTEIVAVAKQRGTFSVALESIVEHRHPQWGKGADDAVYRLGRESAGRDQRLFEQRLAAHVEASV